MRKRSIYLLVLAIFTISAVCSGTAFAETTTAFDLSASQTANFVGDSFTVTVAGQNVTEMAAYEIQLKFDKDKLSFDADKTQSLSSDIYSISPIVDGNEITLRAAKKANATLDSGNFDLCRLTFNRKAEGDASVTLGTVQILNAGLAATEYVANKTVTVNMATVTPPPVTEPDNNGDSSDNPSGSSGGSFTSTATDSAISTPSSASSGGTISINAQKGQDGVVSAAVGPDEMQKAIESAVDGDVNILVESKETANEVRVNLPAAKCFEAGQKNISVKLVTPFGMISFNPGNIMNFIRPVSQNMQLSILKVKNSSLSKEAAQIIGDNSVYNLSISVDGKNVADFGDKAVEMALNYTLRQGEISGKIVLYSILDNRTPRIVKNGKYSKGKVKFSTNQVGKYAAVHIDVNFSDLSKVNWAEESIEALAARGAIDGINGGAFNPGEDITRAQFIKILMSTFDLPDTSSNSTFKDVKKGAWYYSAVASAEKLGIIKGDGKGNFGIDDRITRQDMAVMVYRLGQLVGAELKGSGNPATFKDQKQIASYAAESISSMQNSGIIKGMADGRFAPSKNASRAESAVVIYRLYNITD